MKLKRYLKNISLALVLVLLLPVIMSCGEQNDNGSATASTTAEISDNPVTTVPPADTEPEPTEPPTTTAAPTELPTDPPNLAAPDANGIIAGARYYLKSFKSGLYLESNGKKAHATFTQEDFTGKSGQMFSFESLGNNEYKITSLGASSTLLDMENGLGEKAVAVESTDAGTPNGENSQIWIIHKYEDDGAYCIVSKASGPKEDSVSGYSNSITVKSVSMDPGGEIIIWGGESAANQKWIFELVSEHKDEE